MLLKFVKYLCKFGFGVDDKIQIRQNLDNKHFLVQLLHQT